MDADAQTRLAIAALVAALVKTLGERDRTFAPAFKRNLEETAETLRETGTVCAAVFDTLERTQELLEENDIEAEEPAWIVYAKQRDPDLVETLQHDYRVPIPTLAEALSLWEKLPQHDRDGTIIETMSGRRLDLPEVEKILARKKGRSAI